MYSQSGFKPEYLGEEFNVSVSVEIHDRENWPLVTDEPVEFEKELVEVQNSGKLPIILEESMEYTSNK